MTELPAYNQLIRDAEKFLEGGLDPEQMEATLRDAEDTLDALYSEFFEGLRFQEEHPVLEQSLDPIFQAFDRLAAHREPLREALAEGRQGEVRQLLDEGSEALRELHAQFALLREALGSAREFCGVPAVDELARVVEAFLRGGLPEEALADRIAQFADYHVNLADSLASMQPSPAESGQFQSEELHDGLDLQARGVTLLEEALTQRDPELLEHGLEQVLTGTRALVALRQRLEGAEEPRERLCVRCAAANPATARFCSHCQAQLPDLGPLQPGPSFEASDLEPVQAALPANLQILSQQVDRMRVDQGDREEFLGTLRWLGDNISRSRRLLANLEEPPPETPVDQLEALAQAQDAMEAGMRELEEGLAVLESFLGRPDPARLDHGMELARRGAGQMREVEAIFARIRRG